MKFTNTIQVMQKLGAAVVKEGKAILKKNPKHTTRANTLYKGFKYNVKSSEKNVYVEWVFGKADDYWDFVNEGVKGSGGYKPGKKFKSKRGGTGLMRGQGSPFSFKKKNIAKGVVLKWIANKPLKLRNAKGQFKEKTQANLKTAAFLIGRAIAQRGLTRTLFFDKPYKKQEKIFNNKILEAFGDDIMNDIKNTLK